MSVWLYETATGLRCTVDYPIQIKPPEVIIIGSDDNPVFYRLVAVLTEPEPMPTWHYTAKDGSTLTSTPSDESMSPSARVTIREKTYYLDPVHQPSPDDPELLLAQARERIREIEQERARERERGRNGTLLHAHRPDTEPIESLTLAAMDKLSELIGYLEPKFERLHTLADKLTSPGDPEGYDKMRSGWLTSERFRDSRHAAHILSLIDRKIREYVNGDQNA